MNSLDDRISQPDSVVTSADAMGGNPSFAQGNVAQVVLYFLIRVLLVGFATGVWLTAVRFATPYPLSGGVLWCLAIIYVFTCFGFCNAFDCFRLGLARVRELTAWFALAVFFTDLLMLAVYLLAVRMLPNLLVFLAAWVLQSLIGMIVVLVVNRSYYHVMPLCTVCAIITQSSFEKQTLVKMSTKPDRFDIRQVLDATAVSVRDVHALALDCNTLVVGDVDAELRQEIVRESYVSGRTVIFIPTVHEILFGGYKSMQVLDSILITERNEGLTLEQRAMKRGIDIVGGIVGLVLSAIPIAICAVIIKVTDGGTVFYTQKRLTRDGHVFTAYKLRSMCMDAEKNGAQLTVPGDPRITPIGRVIRACRLDETPQFWNILKGEMSLVGPRSERLETSEAYTTADPAFAYRLKVKTGLTGYAQINGSYSTSYEDKLRMDLYYIRHWSLTRDFALMLETLKILFVAESTTGFDVAQIDALMERGAVRDIRQRISATEDTGAGAEEKSDEREGLCDNPVEGASCKAVSEDGLPEPTGA